MELLLIGLSNIARRRVLPALIAHPEISKIHVGSNRADADSGVPVEKRGLVIHGYERALDSAAPCLAYISLTNHLHAQWTIQALQRGCHVIVDKPAFLSESDLAKAVGIAKDRRLCLAEAVVWPFHDQVRVLKQTIAERSWKVRAMQASFTFPPLSPDNFRNDPARGGGALADLGAYAVSPGRVFFDESPAEVACRVLGHHPTTGVNNAFAFEAQFSGGRSFQGFYSFATEYRNSLALIGDSFAAELNPAFTMPSTTSATIQLRSNNKTQNIDVPASDMFHSFIGAVVSSIKSNSQGIWADILQQDARTYFRAVGLSGASR